MILSLRQIKRKIRSIESTKKITRAMQMVSAAKLSRIESLLFSERPYCLKLESIMNRLFSAVKTTAHPLLEDRLEKKYLALCVITSDSGLCSTYNENIIRLAESFIGKYGRDNVKLVAIGKRGFSYFKKRGFNITHSYVGLSGRYSEEIAEVVVKALTNLFLYGQADEVYIAYTHFAGTLRYKPILRKFLNIGAEKETREYEYILEPNEESVLDELMPRYLQAKINDMLIDAFTSEHSQRMSAMQAATDNATELIDSLTLMRNKARQAAITKEIIEVSSAAEGLKG